MFYLAEDALRRETEGGPPREEGDSRLGELGLDHQSTLLVEEGLLRQDVVPEVLGIVAVGAEVLQHDPGLLVPLQGPPVVVLPVGQGGVALGGQEAQLLAQVVHLG